MLHGDNPEEVLGADIRGLYYYFSNKKIRHKVFHIDKRVFLAYSRKPIARGNGYESCCADCLVGMKGYFD